MVLWCGGDVMRNSFRVFLFAGMAVTLANLLAGCAGGPLGEPGPKERTGMLVGSMTGALMGSALAGGSPGAQTAAVLTGLAIGGLLGNRIGAAMDEEDRQYAYDAQMSALDRGRAGAPTGWRNPHSGRHGSIVPGPAYNENGMRCRSYTHTVYLDGQPEISRGTACRTPDGSWAPAD
jgi:surface antigen